MIALVTFGTIGLVVVFVAVGIREYVRNNQD